VHPTALPRLRQWFAEAFARGQMQLVAGPALPCRSLLSLRTVALAPTQQLKLACPMHTTSARRGVSPMSVHNGPLVSRVIADIQQRDRETAPLVLMPEPAAAGLEPERVGARAGELGAILRGVPPLPEGACAWVCAAIGERWPGTNELVLERAAAGYPGGRLDRLAALIDDWLALLVRPALRLYARYGVALELHTQNTLVCVAAGRLLHVRVRDLGGIRIHGPRLARHVATLPSFATSSFIISDDLDEVRGKLEHSLFHAHLTALFNVAGSLGLDERRCWASVRRMLADCHDRWQAEPGLDAEQRRAMAIDFEALTRPRVRAKALLRMRLHERSSDYDYTLVDNVLADPSERAADRLP
jgi:siderophore synthetase component